MCDAWHNSNGIKILFVSPHWLLYNIFSKIRCYVVHQKGHQNNNTLMPPCKKAEFIRPLSGLLANLQVNNF